MLPLLCLSFRSLRSFLHSSESAGLMEAFPSDILHPSHPQLCPGRTGQAWGQCGTQKQRAAVRVCAGNLGTASATSSSRLHGIASRINKPFLWSASALNWLSEGFPSWQVISEVKNTGAPGIQGLCGASWSACAALPMGVRAVGSSLWCHEQTQTF